MKPGPKPTPTALKTLRGNPGKRALNEAEPKPAPGMPERPRGLSESARRVWDSLAPQLISCGVLTRVDGAVLAGFCQHYALWQKAVRAVEKDGLTVTSPSGVVKANPNIKTMNAALSLVLKAGAELGIGPASRSRITATPPEPEKGRWDGLLN